MMINNESEEFVHEWKITVKNFRLFHWPRAIPRML